VMDADGKNLQRITDNTRDEWYPTWSPDGKQIAFNAGNPNPGGEITRRVYVMGIDGKNKRLLTEEHAETPCWSPDGEKIAFRSWRGGRVEVCVIDVDGKNFKQLTQGGGNDPVWSPALEELTNLFLQEEKK